MPPVSAVRNGVDAAANASRVPDAQAVNSDAAALDVTAESVPDTVATLAEAFGRRAEVVMLVQQSRQQEMQARLDAMKAAFNAATERRSEQMRELNVLRDMALDQAKKDDEVLKKYIALI